MAQVIDGKELSKRLNGQLKLRVAELPRPPGLAVVLVGEDPASQVYVKLKGQVAGRLGFSHTQIDLPASTSEAELLAVIDRLDVRADIDGILVQMPLPKHIDPNRVIDRIDPAKDVDGLGPTSQGLLSQGRPTFVSCTPKGVMRLLAEVPDVSLAGRDAVVLGRSNIVGRPMVHLLEQANCTVTVCHSRTRDLAEHVRRAEVLVAAIGKPALVRGEWVRDGAVVIDVGVNRMPDGSLVGDVEYEAAAARARAITPVPGGVGPMTIAMLMSNTFDAAQRRLAGSG